MRRLVKIAPILTLIAVLLMGTLSVSAYGYKISVSAGNGEFANGQVRDEVPAGEINVSQTNNTITVGGKTYTITKMPDGKAPADSKYFFAGIKLAGHDNANASTSITLDVDYKDKDLEFVVAYGMKSSMVSYTINYVDAAGNAIHPADTFYGVAGDTVTVSYKYVDGYIPQALTGVGVLDPDSAKNNWAFVYNPAGGTGQVITVVDGVTVINAAGAGAGAGAGARAGAGAGAPGAAIGDNATPLANGPADTVNLNDGTTPTTDNPDATDVDDSKGPLANIPTAGKIAGAAAIIAAIAAIVAAIARRNAGDDDDDDDEDDEE